MDGGDFFAWSRHEVTRTYRRLVDSSDYLINYLHVLGVDTKRNGFRSIVVAHLHVLKIKRNYCIFQARKLNLKILDFLDLMKRQLSLR